MDPVAEIQGVPARLACAARQATDLGAGREHLVEEPEKPLAVEAERVGEQDEVWLGGEGDVLEDVAGRRVGSDAERDHVDVGQDGRGEGETGTALDLTPTADHAAGGAAQKE